MKITFFSTQHFSNVKCMQSQAKPFHGLTSESELYIYIYYNFSCVYINPYVFSFIYIFVYFHIHILCFMFIFIIHLHIYIYTIYFSEHCISDFSSLLFALPCHSCSAAALGCQFSGLGRRMHDLASQAGCRGPDISGCDRPNAYSKTWTFF